MTGMLVMSANAVAAGAMTIGALQRIGLACCSRVQVRIEKGWLQILILIYDLNADQVIL